MQINLREFFLLILIVALALGWWLDRRLLLKAPVPPAAAASVGRWQMAVSNDGRELLLDTTTGETWRYSDYAWHLRQPPRK